MRLLEKALSVYNLGCFQLIQLKEALTLENQHGDRIEDIVLNWIKVGIWLATYIWMIWLFTLLFTNFYSWKWFFIISGLLHVNVVIESECWLWIWSFLVTELTEELPWLRLRNAATNREAAASGGGGLMELEDISEPGAAGTIIISCQPLYQSQTDSHTQFLEMLLHMS